MSRCSLRSRIFPCWIFAAAGWIALPAASWAAPSVADALKLKPVQSDVPYDTPEGTAVKDCTIKAEKIDGATAWVIRKPNGDALRQFSDSDNDNVVDTWSYYRDGLEVYRDVDADFNGKADQYRWFHGAGMRWGVDRNEDGKIDSWKLISAEEAAEEVAEALRTKDTKRFGQLLLSGSELKQLKLSDGLTKQIAERVQSAPAAFRELAGGKEFGKDLEFRDFGGVKPGMVPSGTRGENKDLLVYENVWAMVRNGEDGEFQQLQLGTMINLKGAWKLIDGPTLANSGEVAGNLFFGPGGGNASGASAATMAAAGTAPNEKMQEILGDLEKLDQQLMQASGKQKQKLNLDRAGLLKQLAEASAAPAESEQWYRQLADMVSAATQDGSFADGLDYLDNLEQELAKKKKSDDLLAYIEFQRMLAEYYGVTLAKAGVNHAKAHAAWLKDLEAFVEDHPKNANCAEALRQLAMGSEISGEDEEAVKWYQQILEDHADSIHAAMAKGAVTRLSSEGRPIGLVGNAVNGGKVDLADYRGKAAVVIQYWTTTSDVCKADHSVLGDLYKKYGGRRGLEIIGVNLNYSRDELMEYLEETKLPWPQLYEAGGFESRFAKEMGVVTVPLMILVGPNGKVIRHNIQAAEIEEAIKALDTRQAKKP